MRHRHEELDKHLEKEAELQAKIDALQTQLDQYKQKEFNMHEKEEINENKIKQTKLSDEDSE